MIGIPINYQPLAASALEAIPAEAWLSPDLSDPVWDDFLRSTPLGHYQQSGLWAEFKAGEGWRHHRVVLTGGTNVIVGGFQILWRKKGPLRIGYVSKGPVAHPAVVGLQAVLTTLLDATARELGLHALIAQLPDESPDLAEDAPGFVRSNPMHVIEATYLVDVGEGMEAVRKRMHRNVRQCVRKAREQGVTIRAGSEADLPRFFALMSATCRRQGTTPNPGSIESLRRLWQLFARSGDVEMSFAGRDGCDIAGRINLVFGNRVTQWKKGWDGSHPNWHPNELLADHALEWASTHGHRLCDFSAINRLTAEHILAGRSHDDTITRSRDMFNLRLGGYPMLLPRARVLLTNPLLRWGYRTIYLPRERQRDRRILAGRP
jgi:hypothetical protein